MKNKPNKTEGKNELDRFERLANHAHKEIEIVSKIYKLAFEVIVIILAALCALVYFFFGRTMDEVEKRVIREIKPTIIKRVDDAFDTKNIEAVVIRRVEERIDRIEDKLITQKIDKRIWEHNHIFSLYLGAVKGSRKDFDELAKSATTPSASEYELAKSRFDEIRGYYEQLKSRVLENRLVLVATGQTYTPYSEKLLYGIHGKDVPTKDRRAYVNKVGELRLRYFVEELITVIKEDHDLTVAARAAKAVEDISGVTFTCVPPFTDVLGWWEKTGRKNTEYRSPFPRIKELEEKSDLTSDELLDSYLEIVKDKKGLADARLKIADIYLEQGQYDKAIEQLKTNVSESDQHIESLILYATWLAKENKIEKAKAYYEQAMKFVKYPTRFRNILRKYKKYEDLFPPDKLEELIKK